MQSSLPEIPHFVPAPVTKEQLDYADLCVIDLALAQTAEGRAQLVSELRKAMSTLGFFYVINHGLSSSQVTRMFDIADLAFSGVNDGEKEVYRRFPNMGDVHGYKLRDAWEVSGGVRDQHESYAIHRDVTRHEQPKPLRPLLPEIAEFARHNHYEVVEPILKLMALGLELPEDTLVKYLGSSSTNDSVVRFIKYFPMSQEQIDITRNVWLKGHTDFGTLTVLYSQPVSGLQILLPDGQWKWIRHIENALVINAGDVIELLSGGIYKATVHRVFQPPADQRDSTRLGVFYFATGDDDVKLEPLRESPVLQRVGIARKFESESVGKDLKVPTIDDWQRARSFTYGRVPLMKSEGGKIESEVVYGLSVNHYN